MVGYNGIPEELDDISTDSKELVLKMIIALDKEKLVDHLDSKELKLFFKCKNEAFELCRNLDNLKGKIILRNKDNIKKKPGKK